MERREFRFAVTMSIAHGMQHFFRRLLPPLIPVWGIVFGYPLWKLGLLVGASSFGTAIAQAPFGVLSDRYDRRHILAGGIGAIGASYVVFAAAPTLAVGIEGEVAGYAFDDRFLIMLVSIFVAGIAAATLHPAGYPLITANVSESWKGRVLGMWGSASKFGDGLSPAAVGVLLLVVSWDLILGVFGALGVVYAAYLFLTLGQYETHPDDREETGESDDFDVWNTDLRLYVLPMVFIFLFFAIRGIGQNGVNVFIPEFVTSVYGYTVTVLGFEITPESTASFYFSALMLTAGFVQLGTGVLVDRYDGRLVILGFLAIASPVLAVLAIADLSPVALFFVLLAFGAAMWGMSPARDALISEITPEAREGRTFGYLWTGIGFVSSASPVIVGYIGGVAGLRTAFGLLSVAIALSAIPILLLFSDRVYLRYERWREESAAD